MRRLDPRPRATSLAAVLVLASACGDDDAAHAAPDAGCGSTDERAATLLEGANHCASDADCALVTVDAECVVPFLCPVLVSEDTDLERLSRQARELAETAARCEVACPIANCAAPDTFRIACDPVEHRCTVAAPAGDAGGS